MGALSAVRHTPRLALVACSALALLVSCGDDNAVTSQISVSDAWALATVSGQPNGAVYFTVMSVAADTLASVSVPESIADHTELHEATTTNGQVGMHSIESVPLDPGTAVTFTPGGMHVMLVELARPLTVGETFDVTLEFAKADPITLPVAVVESAP